MTDSTTPTSDRVDTRSPVKEAKPDQTPVEKDSDLSRPENRVVPAGGPTTAETVPLTLTADSGDRQPQRPPERPPTTAAAPAMSPEALTAAARDLRQNMGNREHVEATLRAIPVGDRERFEQMYQTVTGKNLREEMRRAGLERSIALLEPREETRNAAWLNERLSQLGGHNLSTTQRNLLEQSIRNNLRSMSDGERQSLNDELLRTTGKTLAQTIAGSRMSEASKEAATIYAERGPNVSPAELSRIVERAMDIRTPPEQRLMLLKEALAGDSEAAIAARQRFMQNNGEQRLHRMFSGQDLMQAQDYARLGRLDTPTLVALQACHWADNDKGVELALRLMTPEQRQMASDGERLARSGRTDLNAAEARALDYYTRLNRSLEDAAVSYTSPSRWSGDNRRAQVTAWMDLAQHGEETLIGRLARQRNMLMPENPGDLVNTIRNFTQRDFELMRDPTYRQRVYDMLGNGDPSRGVFSRGANEAARRELDRVFGADTPQAARDRAHPTLRDAGGQFNQFMEAQSRNQHNPASLVYDSLMNGRSAEYNQLSEAERHMLAHRVERLPEAQRESARQMLAELRAGRDVQAGLPERLHLDALSGASRQQVMDRLLGATPQERASPRTEQAARAALGDGNFYQTYAKPVLEGRGLTAEQLRELNWRVPLGSGALGGFNRPGYLDQDSYYGQLRQLNPEERQRILAAADPAKANDPESRRLLDRAFGDLTPQQREIALNVLCHPNQEFTLVDRIRSRATGGNSDRESLINEFTSLSAAEKLAAVNEYARRYGTYLPGDLGRGTDEGTRRRIDLSLPMSPNDLFRASQDWAREAGTGLYGNVASQEISLQQTQQMIRNALLDRLPADQRQRVQQEIEQSFQRYVRALQQNDQAKETYARDLADKIMAAALTVAAPGIGASLTRLALTAAAAMAARAGIEGSVRGTLTGGDVVQAGLFGIMDAATFGRTGAFRQFFGEVAGKALGTELSAAARREITENAERYMRSGTGPQELARVLERHGVQNAEQRSRQILEEYAKGVVSGATNDHQLAELALAISLQHEGDNILRTAIGERVAQRLREAGANAGELIEAARVLNLHNEPNMVRSIGAALAMSAGNPERTLAIETFAAGLSEAQRVHLRQGFAEGAAAALRNDSVNLRQLQQMMRTYQVETSDDLKSAIFERTQAELRRGAGRNDGTLSILQRMAGDYQSTTANNALMIFRETGQIYEGAIGRQLSVGDARQLGLLIQARERVPSANMSEVQVDDFLRAHGMRRDTRANYHRQAIFDSQGRPIISAEGVHAGISVSHSQGTRPYVQPVYIRNAIDGYISGIVSGRSPAL